MKLLQLAVITGSVLALSAGVASAQYSAPSPSTGATSNSMSAKPASKMSNADKQRMKACKAMSRDAAMKDTGCVKMMKAHPEMMGSDGAMSSDTGSMAPKP
jgi:hypothetical protein